MCGSSCNRNGPHRSGLPGFAQAFRKLTQQREAVRLDLIRIVPGGRSVQNEAVDAGKSCQQREVTVAVTRKECLRGFRPALVADEVGRAHSFHGTRQPTAAVRLLIRWKLYA